MDTRSSEPTPKTLTCRYGLVPAHGLNLGTAAALNSGGLEVAELLGFGVQGLGSAVEGLGFVVEALAGVR